MAPNEPFPSTAGYHVLHATATCGPRKFPIAFGLFLPPSYFDATEPFPMVVTMHNVVNDLGGSNGQNLAGEGLAMHFVQEGWDGRMSGERPKGAVEVRPGARFIGLVPQCPKEFGFDHEPMSEVIVALVDEVGRHCRLDRDRVSLTGFSYGASCTWAVATRHPEAFAAIVPVAGRLPADPELTARRLAGVAIWMAVGRGDETFYPLSEKMHAVLAAAQHPRLIYTVIPGGNHFCYGAVYRDPKFWPWLLAQRRGQSAGR